MAKKTWEVILIILGIAVEIAVLIKDKILNGGKNDDNGSRNPKA